MQFRAFLSSSLAISALSLLSLESAEVQSAPPQAPQQSSQSTAQSASSQTPTIVFRQTVRRVIVDVTVHDEKGNPVHGLTRKDFTLLEDTQPQHILSFDVYDYDKASISRGPNAPPLPPNLFLNIPDAPEHGPLYVILYDLVNTENDDQMWARQQILKFIKDKPEGTRFAVFANSDGLHLIQGFTADKNVLYSAFDPKHPRHHLPMVFLLGRNYGRTDPYSTIAELTFISRYLDGIPGRKNLIWVAGSFPTAIFPRASDPVDAQDDINSEMNALAQAEVAVFPISARPLNPNCEGCMNGAGPHTGVGGESPAPPPGGAPEAVASGPTSAPGAAAAQTAANVVLEGGNSIYSDMSAEDAIALATGGKATYNNNDLSTSLEEATQDGANYYTLTYAPPAPDDRKCHNIVVRVDRPKYQLSYRRAICRTPLVSTASDEEEEKSSFPTLAIPVQAGDVLQANMKPGAPMLHDLVFSAHVRTDGAMALATPEQMEQLQAQVALYRTGRKKKPQKPLPPTKVQTYTVDYRVLDPQLKAEASLGRQPTLEFAVAAFDLNGKMLNGVVNDSVPEISTDPAKNQTGLFLVHQSLAVPAGAVSIRVGVRDRISDRMGTLEVPLPLKSEPVAKISPSVG